MVSHRISLRFTMENCYVLEKSMLISGGNPHSASPCPQSFNNTKLPLPSLPPYPLKHWQLPVSWFESALVSKHLQVPMSWSQRLFKTQHSKVINDHWLMSFISIISDLSTMRTLIHFLISVDRKIIHRIVVGEHPKVWLKKLRRKVFGRNVDGERGSFH